MEALLVGVLRRETLLVETSASEIEHLSLLVSTPIVERICLLTSKIVHVIISSNDEHSPHLSLKTANLTNKNVMGWPRKHLLYQTLLIQVL